MVWHRRGLWRDPEFPKLWAGETISLVGSQVTLLALPLTASILLQASPFQMGVLGASQTIPFLLFGLVAGVWVDRLRRRPIMLVADLGRALLLATIPAAVVLTRINASEPRPVPPSERQSVWAEICDGFRAVTASPILRTLIGTVGLS